MDIKLDLAAAHWPDRWFLFPGEQHLLVEFKRPGEKPRPAQHELHRRLAARGFTVHIIDNTKAFRALLDAEIVMAHPPTVGRVP